MKTSYLAGFVVSVCLALTYFLFYLSPESYTDFMNLFSSVFPAFISGLAFVLGVFIQRKYWKTLKDKSSKIWFGFTLGLALLFLAHVSRMVYKFVLNVTEPYPSVADALWLTGYIPLAVALLWYIRTFKSSISRRVHADVAFAVTVVSMVIYASLMYPIIQTETVGYRLLIFGVTTALVDVAYPTLDLILFPLSILGLLISMRGKLAQAWSLISGAVLFIVVADLLFTYTWWQDLYYRGHPLELFFYWGYILFALAFYTHAEEPEQAPAPSSVEIQRRQRPKRTRH